MTLTIPLTSGKFYHIFNNGNNGINLFYNPKNYGYFLRKYDEYLSDYLETFCFCLMPNHFHLLVRVKEINNMNENAFRLNDWKKLKDKAETENKDLAGLIVSESFRRFFMAYTKAVNKQEEREGSLFKKYFKRKEVTNLKYLQQLVCYIHRNPVHHGFNIEFADYPWNSYSRMLEERITKLQKKDVIDWFGDRENYMFMHQQKLNLIDDLIIE